MGKEFIDQTPIEAANSGAISNGRVLAVRVAEEKLRRALATDGQFYSFSTVEILAAAEKKWGEKSRRVKPLYELLEEMILAKEVL